MRRLTVSDLRAQELETQAMTELSLAGFLESFECALNLIIGLLYVKLPPEEDSSSQKADFRSHVRHWVYLSVFTFHASVSLMSRGYYYEAHILNRSLLEVLTKIRYFHVHPERLKTFESIANKKKASITFKKMMDEVLPGMYDEYSWMFSYTAHGGTGARMFKITHPTPSEAVVDTGIFYKETFASMIVNCLVVFLLGYIRAFHKVFPEIRSKMDPKEIESLDSVQGSLEKMIKEHIHLKGGENEWHRAARSIWEI